MMHLTMGAVSSTASITPHLMDWVLLVTVLVISTTLDSFQNRGKTTVSTKRACTQVLVWTGVALAFGIYIGLRFNWTAAGEYYAAYPMELSLSTDNVFVFQTIFAGVLLVYRPVLLTWAVVLAVALRGALLGVGTELLEAVAFMEVVFGILLILAAIQMFRSLRRHREEVTPLEEMRTYKVLRSILPFTNEWHGLKPIVRQGRGIAFTPVALVIGCIAAADLVFALDSIPAVLAVTRDPYLAFAAVMFAVINLKSLFFVYQWVVSRLPRLNHVLVLVLGLIGAKLMAGYFGHHVHPFVATAVVIAVLVSGGVWSMVENRCARRRQQRQPRELVGSSAM